jgi:hypothetical protein
MIIKAPDQLRFQALAYYYISLEEFKQLIDGKSS